MAKRKRDQGESRVESPESRETHEVVQRFPAEEVERAEISAPLGDTADGGYAQRHIDVQLNQRQAVALRRLVLGLDVTSARLSNDRRVISGADAIRWLLEAVNGKG